MERRLFINEIVWMKYELLLNYAWSKGRDGGNYWSFGKKIKNAS